MPDTTTRQVRLAGTGGQGLGLAGRLLADACVAAGHAVAQSQTYEPTSRGGSSRSDLVVAAGTVDYPLVTALDALLLLDQAALEDAPELLRDGALVVTDAALVPRPPTVEVEVHALPLTARARELGNPRVANMVGLGALVGLAGWPAFEQVEQAVVTSTPARFRDLNLAALRAGRALVATDASAA
ncbi:MAG: 2-oxoacid:acceptor oxidoreductase family protein [Gammaproteobacteria bacterium]